MKGMAFVEIIEGRMVSQGVVVSQAGENHWLCKFFGKPAVSRVVPVENMSAMTLFDSMTAMDQWIEANSQEPDAPETPDKPADDGDAPKLVPVDELTDDELAAIADDKAKTESKANGTGSGKNKGAKEGRKRAVNKSGRPSARS